MSKAFILWFAIFSSKYCYAGSYDAGKEKFSTAIVYGAELYSKLTRCKRNQNCIDPKGVFKNYKMDVLHSVTSSFESKSKEYPKVSFEYKSLSDLADQYLLHTFLAQKELLGFLYGLEKGCGRESGMKHVEALSKSSFADVWEGANLEIEFNKFVISEVDCIDAYKYTRHAINLFNEQAVLKVQGRSLVQLATYFNLLVSSPSYWLE